jgi:DNA-binding NtrC family response regulator
MAESDRHPILIVDDEPEVLYSLRALLRRDFELHTAQTAYEAEQVLQSQPIHVVLSDQRMPGVTGVDFLTRVHREHPDTVRLLLTGYADIRAVIDAINRGHVYRYLTKPWDADELRLVLRQACEHYEQAGSGKRLLAEARDYLTGCLARLEARPEDEALLRTGRELLERLGRELS